ncbi:Aste57867_16838 [Aphanomyces stellatus]|uniref:Aste57867_16838 protein n=1 Tax=Aphanomyces stellatus TaxID=120398 RepID=A0A485L7A3_9STRA|nr:hypothetical protein As57867_016780 [Aphanomyces stellatus]VFT93602.1 Aste57867_16838 [Aphanomyces stellatus]
MTKAQSKEWKPEVSLPTIKAEELQAIEERLLQLERRLKKDHENRARFNALQEEAPKKVLSLYEQEHHAEQGRENDRGVPRRDSGRKKYTRGGGGDDDNRTRGRHGRDDKEPHWTDGHRPSDSGPLNLHGKHAGDPGMQTLLVVTVVGLVLVVGFFVFRKIRKQRTRSYQSID